jgi:hypothetical protein
MAKMKGPKKTNRCPNEFKINQGINTSASFQHLANVGIHNVGGSNLSDITFHLTSLG